MSISTIRRSVADDGSVTSSTSRWRTWLPSSRVAWTALFRVLRTGPLGRARMRARSREARRAGAGGTRSRSGALRAGRRVKRIWDRLGERKRDRASSRRERSSRHSYRRVRSRSAAGYVWDEDRYVDAKPG